MKLILNVLFSNFKKNQLIVANDLVVVKIATLDQYGVMWNKITVVAAMLLVVKKGTV